MTFLFQCVYNNYCSSLPLGPLQYPSNFSVNISNSSNTTFLLSWGAPFSLDVTDSPDIFYYTLCTNITIYGCKNISSDPDCIFPRTCTSSVDFTGHSLNATSGGQNKTIMDYVDPIHFTFFAVNGAGNGSKANFTYFFKMESGLCTYKIWYATVAVHVCLLNFLYCRVMFVCTCFLICNNSVAI